MSKSEFLLNDDPLPWGRQVGGARWTIPVGGPDADEARAARSAPLAHRGQKRPPGLARGLPRPPPPSGFTNPVAFLFDAAALGCGGGVTYAIPLF